MDRQGLKRKKARTLGNLIRGTFRSNPGEPPMKQTGRLLGSIAIEPIRELVIARVGTNVSYGRYLEFGTRHMKARPWLRRALIEQQRNIQSILSRPFVVR